MIKKKIFFGLFIVFFLFFLVFFTLSFNFIIELPKKEIVLIEVNKENPNKDLDCSPVYLTKPTIVLRLDDIRRNTYRNIRIKLIDKILENNMSVVIGVIPEGIENDLEIKRYIKKHIENPRFEVAQHGYLHSAEEFRYLDETEAYERLEEGHKKMFDSFGFYPVTFIPPHNVYSDGTIKALKKIGFKIISSQEDEYKFDGSMFFLGENIKTYDYDNKRFVPSEEILRECGNNLVLRNICVITMHPQEYSTNIDNPVDLSEERFQEFELMLDKLQELNAKFATFKDLVVCSD